MATLSELVERELKDEIKIIETTGKLWLTGISAFFGLAILWVLDFLFGEPWTKRESAFGIVFVFIYPFANRAWERHKVAAEMRHHREVRTEMKLNVLLGLVRTTSDDQNDLAEALKPPRRP